jgi:hypothetical protein
MSRWFRSEPMEYISLIVNEDAAHDCLADLGKLGVIQFTDVSRHIASLLLCVLAWDVSLELLFWWEWIALMRRFTPVLPSVFEHVVSIFLHSRWYSYLVSVHS